MTAPIPIQVTRHQCPHCRRTWRHKAAAVAHVGRCWRSPAAQGCKTCTHFSPADSDGPYPEHPGWPEECGQGLPLADGIRTGCPQWKPAP